MNYFVTGIDTDSGKTVVSAILCEALQADYWKPVQAGFPRDAETVKSLVSNQTTIIHPEQYLLNTPASPHASAALDGITIRLDQFELPATSRTLIIEGAGGCLVPLNDNYFIIDLISTLKTEVIVVADLYLGSINHTLLTLEALARRQLPVKGIIFNGDANPESQRIILSHTKCKMLLHVQKESVMSRETIKKYARLLNDNWHE